MTATIKNGNLVIIKKMMDESKQKLRLEVSTQLLEMMKPLLSQKKFQMWAPHIDMIILICFNMKLKMSFQA